METPAAARLAGFAGALRRAGIALEPSRTADFLAAIAALPLRSADELRRAGRVVFARQPEHLPVYERVFAHWFLGEAPPLAVPAPPPSPEEERDDRDAADDAEAEMTVLAGDAKGRAAASDHLAARKSFGRPSPALARQVAAFGRAAARDLPVLPSRRRRPRRRGDAIDLRRTAAEARRHGGEPVALRFTARPPVRRPLLLLIDVSGSMKAQSEIVIRLAHALRRHAPRLEAFTFGTGLTRVTAELRQREPAAALARLAEAVRDFDGGTRIGPSLAAFLRHPRSAAKARGAIVIVVSDGLERGDPEPMRRAVARLSLLAHRLVWASPLAADPAYRPVTRAMAAILPHLDALRDGSGIDAFRRLFVSLAGVEARPRRALRPPA